ncbi:MAG: DNA primase [Gammaproteobacteria bacterium]|nr:DNA primase [Gammaproteobacteria bacterium]
MAENIFEKVLQNVDIKDVVSRYVQLEPKGKNLFGLCPFHDDHSPSMSVSSEKGLFNCFVCHTGGNAIKFIELYKHISSLEAAKFLAQEYHIDISEFDRVSSKEQATKKYYEVMDLSQKFYSFLMNDTRISSPARGYLSKRGITDDIIKEFKIGLSINDDEALIKQLTSKGYLISDLMIASLATENKDLFTDRIMIPIRDEYSRCVAFGGRIYLDGDTKTKYMNSKETPIFKKGELVFNLDKAKDELKKEDYLIVNEGYMDVITEYSHGIKNAVAIMGTNMTLEQASLIKKYTNKVEIVLDGDDAGVHGVKNLIRGFEKVGITYSIIILPDNMDPDEFIRTKGIDEYRRYLSEEKLDIISYVYELTKRNYKEINSFNMESFKLDIFKQIKDEKSNSIIERNLIKLSRDLKISYKSIEEDYKSYISQFNPTKNTENKKITKEEPKFKVTSAYQKAEKIVIDYVLKDKSYYSLIEKEMKSRVFLKDLEYRKLFVTIGDLYDKFGRCDRDEIINKLKELEVIGSYEYSDNPNYSIDDFNGIIKIFKKEELKDYIDALTQKLKSSPLERDERNELLLKLQKMKKELKEYDR